MLAEERAPEFDEAWYGAAYPQAIEDIARGRAQDLHEHYRQLGRRRGYLPYPAAPRPDNPATHRSRFGGLWVDLENAVDLLNGKLELGLIDERRHALLGDFIRDGYVVLPGGVPEPALGRAREALTAAYEGADPEQPFRCKALPSPETTWRPELKALPAKALGLHWRSPAILDAVFAPAICEFLALIFERRALLSQTLGFYRGSAQAVHQDSAYVAYSLPMQFAAAWVALEDVTPGAGELCYYPGSHRFPEHLFGGGYKGAHEASRWAPSVDIRAYEATLPRHAEARGIQLSTFRAKAGDVFIWAADLAHGGMPISRDHSRLSVVAHYCPAEVAPTYFEAAPREIRRHASGNDYATWA
jgi:hypothetical protein